jgi:hypothetical protein
LSKPANAALSSIVDARIDSFLRLSFADTSCANLRVISLQFLIARTNELLNTEGKFVCVSRPRRFGKSMVLKMLAAYYGRDEDSSELFGKLAISRETSYEAHLNQYDVIQINMQDFLSTTQSVEEMLGKLVKYLIYDFSILQYNDENALSCTINLAFYFAREYYAIIMDFKSETLIFMYFPLISIWMKQRRICTLTLFRSRRAVSVGLIQGYL